MKTHKKTNPNRIFWRDFIGTRAFKRIQHLLRANGRRLNIKIDKKGVAHDAFVAKINKR